jgi:hypothetical protein
VSTWTTQSSNNVGKVLDHLKLGLDDETALNIPDTLTYEEIGKPIFWRFNTQFSKFINPINFVF